MRTAPPNRVHRQLAAGGEPPHLPRRQAQHLGDLVDGEELERATRRLAGGHGPAPGFEIIAAVIEGAHRGLTEPEARRRSEQARHGE